jgi:hypothetical protein
MVRTVMAPGLLVVPLVLVLTLSGRAYGTCGDSAIDPGEICDPPGQQGLCPSGSVCSADCASCDPLCGNNVIDAGEACDPPGQQGVCSSGSICSADCSECTHLCGNNVIDTGEICDPPGAKGVCPASSVCQDCTRCIPAGCGNGVLEAGEVCDGVDTCPGGATCNADCTACTACGNGIIEGGEICDPPGIEGACPAGQVCKSGCSTCSKCGNGTIDPGETCDPPSSHLGASSCGADLSCSSSCQCVAPPLETCQIELQNRAAAFYKQVKDALVKCSTAIQKEITLNEKLSGSGHLARGANNCQLALRPVFDTAADPVYMSYRDKFFSYIDKATSAATTSPPKCTRSDLRKLGHLVSGVPALQAPGTNFQDFLKNWLAVGTVRRALVAQMSEVPNFLNLLNAAINAPAYGTSISYAATDCSLPITCNRSTDPGCRPDLCNFRVQCRSHACKLSDMSGSIVNLAADGTVETPVVGHTLIDICTLKDFGFGLGNAGEGMFLMGEPAHQIEPIRDVGGNTICVENLGTEGFCSCDGNFTLLSKDISSCQDHLAGAPNSDQCPATDTQFGGGTEDTCFCGTSSTNVSAVRCGAAYPACPPSSVCGFTGSGAACHPGTRNGPVHLSLSGSTGIGDCVAYNSMRFTTLPPGGQCSPFSSYPASYGPDCTPCTSDDIALPPNVVTVPFTTGSAGATIKDAVEIQGMCADTTNHGCIEHTNCANSTNPSDLCDGTQIIFPTFASSTFTGEPVTLCSNLESGALSGMTLVGAVPILDSPGLGDQVTTFSLTCE